MESNRTPHFKMSGEFSGSSPFPEEMDEVHPSPSKVSPECAYTSSMKEVLVFCIDHNAMLFSNEEVEILRKLHSLTTHSLRLLCRLFMRKTTWIQTHNIHNYVREFIPYKKVRATGTTSQEIPEETIDGDISDQDTNGITTQEVASQLPNDSFSSSNMIDLSFNDDDSIDRKDDDEDNDDRNTEDDGDRYRNGQTREVLIERLKIAMDELIQCELLQTIEAGASFEVSWDLATTMLTIDDWHQLYKMLFNISFKLSKPSVSINSTSTGSNQTAGTIQSGGSNKDEMLRQIKKSLITQRTCFGQSLKEKFSSTLLKYLQQNAIRKMNRSFASTSGTSPRVTGLVSPPIRIATPCLTIMRRAIRLFQMTCTMPGNGSSITSIYQPIDAFVPLLAKFKVLRYEKYEIKWIPSEERSKEEETNSGSNVACVESPLFSNRTLFLQWEAAVELRCLIEEVS